MIGFVIRQMDLEQVQALVDGVDQAELTGHGMEGADPAVREAPAAFGNLIMDVPGGEHRLVAVAELGLVQAAVNAALAVGQFVVYSRVHSKSLRPPGFGEMTYLFKHRKSRDISSFSE